MSGTVEVPRRNKGLRGPTWKPRNERVHKSMGDGPQCTTNGTVTLSDRDNEIDCRACLFHMGLYVPLSMGPPR